jgi:hypothetical protein
MPPTVTFTPDNPRPALDGINIYVSGEVAAPGRVVIYRNSDDKLVGQSPAFGQDAPYRDAEVSLTLTGNPTGGTWALNIEYNDSEADVTGIPYNATAAEIESAINGQLGTATVRVAGDAPGPTTVTFLGEYGGREITVTGSDSLTGGTSPAVDVDTTYVGGKDTDDITSLILPALLLPEGVYDVDLVYAGGEDDGESMLDDMVQIYVAE